MECLKEYIEDLQADIAILSEAQHCAEEIEKAQNNVDTSLTNLKTYYAETVYASEELKNEFHELNKDALETVSSMKKAIEDALETANNNLTQAEMDEESCPVCHPQSDG